MLAQKLVRWGLAIVFLWMGIDKLPFMRPEIWLTQMPKFLSQYGVTIIYVLGIVEIVIGILLLTKLFRIGALGAAGILIGAIWTLGWNDIAARDVGLLLGAIALLLPWEPHVTATSIVSSYRNLLRGKPPVHK